MRAVTVPFFIAHAGCPHRCVFCDQRLVSGSSGDIPSPREIREKIESYRATAGARLLEVAFFGGSFASLPREIQQRLLDPLESLCADGIVTGIRISARPDSITREKAAFLRQRRVGTVEIGVQSMDDGVLRRAGRGHGAAEVDAAFTRLAEGGIRIGAQLMPGLPGDSLATSRRSLDRVIAAGAAFVRIYPAVVLAGTGLAALVRRGEYLPLTLEEGVRWGKVLLRDCIAAGIPVIRLGLQDTPLLAAALEGGPHHPALRHLVETALFHDLLVRACGEERGTVTVRCAAASVSAVAGHRGVNRDRLRRSGIEMRIEENPLMGRWEIALPGVSGGRVWSAADLRYEEES